MSSKERDSSGTAGDAVAQSNGDNKKEHVASAASSESNKDKSMRKLVVFSFWAVVIFLGLPIWWVTTNVYRAQLPLRQMNDWSEGKVCQPKFVVPIAVDGSKLSQADAEQVVTAIQKHLDSSNTFPAHRLQFFLHGEKDTKQRAEMAIRLMPVSNSQAPSGTLHQHSRILDVSFPPHAAKAPPLQHSLAEFIEEQLQPVFTEEKAILQYLLTPSDRGVLSALLSPELVESLARRTARAMKYAPTYHLTFSLFTPEAAPASWDIEEALAETVLPLLKSYSFISNFSIDTQVQPYAAFAPDTNPVYDEKTETWVINREALGGFINSAEWPLSPSIGEGPTINFILYVPSETQRPLTINSTSGNSWLVPQWGGVAILNLDKRFGRKKADLSSKDLEQTMLLFSQQLLSLLGVPSSPEASFPLRLSSLTRIHAMTLLLSASKTLGSLARLTEQLPSISIPDSAADAVSTALKHLDATCDDLKGSDFLQALENARIADWHAEKAFFEKSMVGQVYFPEEHKVAVYLPLLGPIAVPLLMSLVKEILPFIKKLKGR